MNKRTRLQHAIEALIDEMRSGFEPAPERISHFIPQRLLTDWVWSPSGQNIAGRAGWLHVTGEVLAVDPGQAWAVAGDGFYWLKQHDDRREIQHLRELPRPDVDVGSTADLSDEEIAMTFAARTPAEHDYGYDDDEDLS